MAGPRDERLLALRFDPDFKRLSFDIARKVDSLLNERRITGKNIGELVHKHMGVKPISASGQVSKLRSNHFMAFSWTKSAAEKDLYRSAIIFYTLGISPEDEIITRIQQFYPDFSYPPDIHKRHPLTVERYLGTLEELDIGDMRYDKTAEEIILLAEKIKADADSERGKHQLVDRLYAAAEKLFEAGEEMKGAWRICKHYMEK